MAKHFLTHKTCVKEIKAIRRILPDLLSFDVGLSSATTLTPLPEADNAGYDCNIHYLQDKLFELFARYDRECEEDHIVYTEADCAKYAFEKLMEHLNKISEYNIEYSIISDLGVFSIALVAEPKKKKDLTR